MLKVEQGLDNDYKQIMTTSKGANRQELKVFTQESNSIQSSLRVWATGKTLAVLC